MAEYNLDEPEIVKRRSARPVRRQPDYSRAPDGSAPVVPHVPEKNEVDSSVGIAVTVGLVILGFIGLVNGVVLGLLLAIAGGFGLLGGVVAERRGKDFWNWYWLCFCFGWIPLVVLAFTGKTKERDDADLLSSGQHKTCPYCAEVVKIQAIKCKHCGSEIGEKT